MLILNLGCGRKTSDSPDIVNIDWSMYLRIKRNRVLRTALTPIFITGKRTAKYHSIPDNIVCHDLSTGIPFPANSVDGVYHSHFLEHIERAQVPNFLREVKRVLKPTGIHRIVVPDFEILCRKYVEAVDRMILGTVAPDDHERHITRIVGQSVRRDPYATSPQPRSVRLLEKIVLGDAHDRGHTHRWMYDQFTLKSLLEEAGYAKIRIESFETSSIPDWTNYGLDLNEDGTEFRPGSLYAEAQNTSTVRH